MAIDQQVGTANVRAQIFDGVVKGFATQSYKFKQAVTVSSTGAWKNYFFRESPDALTSPTGNNIRGIPRGAAFPQAVVQWERVLATIEKYGLEDNIHWEDLISNDIDVRDRTLFRIAEGVVRSVDDAIWAGLGGTGVVSGIQSFSVVNRSWNDSSAAIIQNLMRAKRLIGEKNYDTSNLMLFVNQRDHASIVGYLADKGAQFPTIGADMASNGRAGSIVGMQIVVSNSVSASNALVVVPKVCGTWRELVPLQTNTTEDWGKSARVRAMEWGTLQLTDPSAVCLIIGTQSANQ